MGNKKAPKQAESETTEQKEVKAPPVDQKQRQASDVIMATAGRLPQMLVSDFASVVVGDKVIAIPYSVFGVPQATLILDKAAQRKAYEILAKALGE